MHGLISRSWLGTNPEYWSEVEPLLDIMELSFATIAKRFATLLASVPKAASPFWSELCDSANITALRALQVHRLYNYAASYWSKPKEYRHEQLVEAHDALTAAEQIVISREANYRYVPHSFRPCPAHHRSCAFAPPGCPSSVLEAGA